jgi:hypothetical protein
MDALTSVFVILIGLVLRLALPIALTVIVISFLRKLDARWQREAERESQLPAAEKTNCWEVKGCTREMRAECPAPKSLLPCWQVNRASSGHLREDCLTCKIFRNAPVPAHTHA